MLIKLFAQVTRYGKIISVHFLKLRFLEHKETEAVAMEQDPTT